MLVPAPYQAPEKKVQKKNKEAKDVLRPKGTSDAVSGETKTHSSEEDEDEEKEEEADSNLPPKGKKNKRAASEDPEAEVPKREKISLPDGSDSDAEAIPEWRPRPKPLAGSYVLTCIYICLVFLAYSCNAFKLYAAVRLRSFPSDPPLPGIR